MYLTTVRRAFRCGAVFFALLFTISGCGDNNGTAAVVDKEATKELRKVATIEGTVTYREKIALRPGAVLEVQLEDVSRADVPATILSTFTITPEGGPPYPFSIEYDPAQIDQRMRYTLRASIRIKDRLLFTNTSSIDAFGSNPVEILVQRVSKSKAPAGPVIDGATWQLNTLLGEDVAGGVNGKPLDIQFQSAEHRVAGFSGCNRYMGGYNNEGTSSQGTPLGFGVLAGTLMACAEGDELERSFRQMLARVTAYQIAGDTLSFLEGAEVLATFKPQ